MKQGTIVTVTGPQHFPFEHRYSVTVVHAYANTTEYSVRLEGYHGASRSILRPNFYKPGAWELIVTDAYINDEAAIPVTVEFPKENQ